MTEDNKKLPDFDLPGWEEPKSKDLSTRLSGFEEKMSAWYAGLCKKVEDKWGKDSRLLSFLKKIEPGKKDHALDMLTQLKDNNQSQDRLQLLVMIILILVLVGVWKSVPPALAKIDQLKNDLSEQEQVIKMEEQNNQFLTKLAEDQTGLTERIHKVYSAVPDSDEKAEEVIAMLEDIAAKNRIIIDAIGIRKVTESQVTYDDLNGVVDVYEYTFTMENNLPHILSFIGALRNSLRLMDIMTLEISEGKTGYKGSFTLHTYNLTPSTPAPADAPAAEAAASASTKTSNPSK